ncbi:hypothetical protein CH375_09850 [Leptospira ellisii]|nr:hypothetical protein CH375_09850 [Leptospira ellisii]
MSFASTIQELFKVQSPQSTHPNAWKRNIIQILLVIASCFGFVVYVPKMETKAKRKYDFDL